MTYNDYGHIVADPGSLPSPAILGRNRSSPFLPGSKSCPAPDCMKSRAWHGRGRPRFEAWTSRPMAGRPGNPLIFDRRRIPWRIHGLAFHWKWDGKECVIMSRCTDELGTVQPTRAEAAKYWNKPDDSNFRKPGAGQYCVSVEDRQRWERSQWAGVSLSCLSRFLTLAQLVKAQSSKYGVGRTPTAEEIHAWDISIGPDGKELPQGHGTAAEGAKLFREKQCVVCHGRDRFRRPGSHLDQKRRNEEVQISMSRALRERFQRHGAACAVRDDHVGLH